MFRTIQQDSCSCSSKYGKTRFYIFITFLCNCTQYTAEAIVLVDCNESIFRRIDEDDCFIVHTTNHIFISGDTAIA